MKLDILRDDDSGKATVKLIPEDKVECTILGLLKEAMGYGEMALIYNKWIGYLDDHSPDHDTMYSMELVKIKELQK